MSTPKPGTVVSRRVGKYGKWIVITEIVVMSPEETARRQKAILEILADMRRRRIARNN